MMLYGEYKARAERAITQALQTLNSPSDRLLEATRYALLGGGKLLRPVLFLAACDLSKEYNERAAKHICFAIEALHTYTLIHDDLPCMDNALMRRGKECCHVVYGEAIAVLAGDSLLTLSMEYMLKAILLEPRLAAGAEYFFNACGMNGLAGGQALDLNDGELMTIAKNKTAALFRVSVLLGGVCAGLSEERLNHLEDCGYNFGMFFQIADDIKDNDGFVALGMDKALELKREYMTAAINSAKKADFEFAVELIKGLE